MQRRARPARPSRDYPKQNPGPDGTTAPNNGFGASGELNGPGPLPPRSPHVGPGIMSPEERGVQDPAAVLDLPTQGRQKQHNPMEKSVAREKVSELAKAFGLDFDSVLFSLDDLWRGVNAETEKAGGDIESGIFEAMKSLATDPGAYALRDAARGSVPPEIADLVADAIGFDLGARGITASDFADGIALSLGSEWSSEDVLQAARTFVAHLVKFEDAPQASDPKINVVGEIDKSAIAAGGSQVGVLNPAQGFNDDEKRPSNTRQHSGAVEGGTIDVAHDYAPDNAHNDLPGSKAEKAMDAGALVGSGSDPGFPAGVPMRLEMKFVAKALDERTVTGVVLQPDEVDAQGDIYGPSVVLKAAERFLSEYGKKTGLGFMHTEMDPPFELLQSFIVPDGGIVLNGVTIVAGSWVMKVRVNSAKIWALVKEGKITGFSIGGVARVRRIDGGIR